MSLQISRFEQYLKPVTYGHLRESCFALDERQYLASVIWAAVFAEAFLGDLLDQLQFSRSSGRDDFNGRIQRLEAAARKPAEDSVPVPDDIVKRFHEIRNVRNRLVHDTGLSKGSLTHEAQLVTSHVDAVLQWYADSGVATVVTPPDDPPPGKQDLIPVFLSKSVPHTLRQQHFLEVFKLRLRSTGIEPQEVLPASYLQRDPLGATREAIERTHAMIVVGLERSHAYFLREKEGGEHELEVTHRKYPSGWLHLEAGIANALGKPVFVICEEEICNDGIFDRKWNSYDVYELKDLDEDASELTHFLGVIGDWAMRFRADSESLQ